ncbi:HAD family phosphatase [Collinsella sp. An2]|uniref:HAD family hydrolase n=1 Tax=Collinsella sp. An2 TaxID=1965585 RepID=UPI001EF5EDC4|nr:HAD family phosphatase [Collinsella sp. An2]
MSQSSDRLPRAFIFDCDGTLLDSMGTWLGIQPRLLEGYGVTTTPDDFAEFEHLSVEDECAAYHEKWHLPDTGEQIYEKLMGMLRAAYAQEIPARTGVKAFLESVAQAGIPMAIATSTPDFLVQSGLEHNGLAGYFDSITTTAEAGRSKQHPDVYNLALKRLSDHCGLGEVDHGDVWVFEDAAFGLTSARAAGYHRVGIFDPAGRTTREQVRELSDISIDEYTELSLADILSFEG